MTGLLIVALLAADPTPALTPDLSTLDHVQLLDLHQQTEAQLPVRWPWAFMWVGGIVSYLPSTIVLLVALANVTSAKNAMDADAEASAGKILIASAIMYAISTALLTTGIVMWRTTGTKRKETLATLQAIDERLDALEHGAGAPPPPPLVEAPAPAPNVGALHLVALDAVTSRPLVAADVVVNGKVYRTDETGAVDVDGLDPGTVELAATRDGYGAAKEYARVIPGRRVNVSVKLTAAGQRAPARLTGVARSAVDGSPLPAKLEVAGRAVTADARGVFATELEPGSYAVRMSAPGFAPQTRSVTVKEGERVIFNVDLQRE